MSASVLTRDDNPRLVSRETWWRAYAAWVIGETTSGPLCTECAEPLPDDASVVALVCVECAPYVREATS